jgi:hypothetical protein
MRTEREGNGMSTNSRRFVWACVWIVLLAAFGLAFAADEPANVAGTWNITASGEAGNASQTIVRKQEGNKITGTFRGPRQSGTLEGAVLGNKISFHVNTRIPLDYQGTVDGDNMNGTLTTHGKSGAWIATREK